MDDAKETALSQATPTEEWFWVSARLRPEKQSHIVQLLCVRGELDVPALRKSLAHVVRQNEALRTVYQLETTRAATGKKRRVLVRTVLEPGDTDVEIIDLRETPPDRKQQLIEERKELEYTRKFDFSVGPLFHFTVMHADQRQYYVFLTLHHIIADGWSANVLLRELGEYYRAFREHAQPDIPPKRAQYSDYIAWRTEKLGRNDYLQKTLDYWSAHLGDIPRMELMRDAAYDPQRSYRFEYHQRRFAFEAGPLGDFNRRYNLRRITLPLAAYALMLSTYSRTDTLAIANVISGRFHPRMNDAIGPFVDTILIMIRPVRHESVSKLLNEIQQQYLTGLMHALVPAYTVFRHLTKTKRLTPSYLADYQVPKIGFAMNYEDARIDPASLLDGVQCEIVPLDLRNRAAPHEMYLAVNESDHELRGHLYCLNDFYNDATVTTMTELYQRIMERVIETPDATVAELLAGIRESGTH